MDSPTDAHLQVVVSRAKNYSFYDPRTSFVAAYPGGCMRMEGLKYLVQLF